jgi:DNA-binding Xre family transcriptional regulator
MIISKLEQVMKERGLTDKDLISAGVNRQTLRKFKLGYNARTDHATLEQLCRILGVQPGDLLEYRP